MAPHYPRPTRQDPPQAGKFMEQANPLLMPMPIEVIENSVAEHNLPEFTAGDLLFLTEIRVRP